MDILGNRRFVEIPGDAVHELPPLLIRTSREVRRLDRVLDMAAEIVAGEDLVMVDDESHRRQMDLAINLAEQYLGLIAHWRCGDSILEWIRQCETTFDTRRDLRNVLRADVWPHAARSSFVSLIADKGVFADIPLEKAVGLRLTFRLVPPISSFSNQFLFYLSTTVAASAYRTWSRLSPDPVASLPPERFHFEVVDIS